MNSDAYRSNAEACAKLVEGVDDPYAKVVLLNMAEAWLRLVDHVALAKTYQIDDAFGATNSPEPDTTRERNPDHDQEA